MWCEAEMREIDPETRPGRRVSHEAVLKRELAARSRELAAGTRHQTTRSGVTIFEPSKDAQHGNFLEASYRRICAHPAWYRRLQKAHTAKKQAALLNARSDAPRDTPWKELDSINSSDALLMNLFCYPRVLAGSRLPALLGIERGMEPLFGFKPRLPLERGHVETTEIDMRVGSLLVEAKLTERSFPPASLRKVRRYCDLDEVLDLDALTRDGEVMSYQLVRGVLAAHHTGLRFSLLYDRRRPEMVAAWQEVVFAVRPAAVRARLSVVTWQEIASAMPDSVRGWMLKKYGIQPA